MHCSVSVPSRTPTLAGVSCHALRQALAGLALRLAVDSSTGLLSDPVSDSLYQTVAADSAGRSGGGEDKEQAHAAVAAHLLLTLVLQSQSTCYYKVDKTKKPRCNYFNGHRSQALMLKLVQQASVLLSLPHLYASMHRQQQQRPRITMLNLAGSVVKSLHSLL